MTSLANPAESNPELKSVDTQPLAVPLGQRLVQPIGSAQPISCYVPYGSQHSNTNTTIPVAGHYVENMQAIDENFKKMMDTLDTLNVKVSEINRRLTKMEKEFMDVACCVYNSTAYYHYSK